MTARLADCRRCRYDGRWFGDEQTCRRHASPAERALHDACDGRAGAIGLRRVRQDEWGSPWGWPYGPNIDVPSRAAMLDWATAGKLRKSTADVDLHWLTGGRGNNFGWDPPAWADHLTGWTVARKPAVLVAQPYMSVDVARESLSGVLSDDRFAVAVHASGWYGRHTVMIEIRRAQ